MNPGLSGLERQEEMKGALSPLNLGWPWWGQHLCPTEALDLGSGVRCLIWVRGLASSRQEDPPLCTKVMLGHRARTMWGWHWATAPAAGAPQFPRPRGSAVQLWLYMCRAGPEACSAVPLFTSRTISVSPLPGLQLPVPGLPDSQP